MRTPLFCIPRGSTPTLELELPFAADPEDVIYLTFSQADRPVLELARNGTAVQPGTGSLQVDAADPCLLLASLTQADTLRLEAGDCLLQVRIRTAGGADTFLPIPGRIGEALKGGVI